MQKVIYKDLGNIEYAEAWGLQQTLLTKAVELKRGNRKRKEANEPLLSPVHNLLFCTHPHVYTLGKSGSMDNLLLDEKQLEAKNATFFKINRGGDITYHGPGQVVGYPIFDMDCFFNDVHRYVRNLEEIIIRTLADYEVNAQREDGYTGVWLPANNFMRKRKICAIGVHLSRWVTMHGFAFNVNTDLSYFKNIVPCGIDDPEKDVTSLKRELGREIDMKKLKKRLKFHFSDVFEFEFE